MAPWGLGSSALKAPWGSLRGRGQGVRGPSCHEHAIFWELGFRGLGIWGYKEAKYSRTFWGLKSKSKRAEDLGPVSWGLRCWWPLVLHLGVLGTSESYIRDPKLLGTLDGGEGVYRGL